MVKYRLILGYFANEAFVDAIIQKCFFFIFEVGLNIKLVEENEEENSQQIMYQFRGPKNRMLLPHKLKEILNKKQQTASTKEQQRWN